MARTLTRHSDLLKVAKWRSKHEQTHNGFKFMKKTPKGSLLLFSKNEAKN